MKLSLCARQAKGDLAYGDINQKRTHYDLMDGYDDGLICGYYVLLHASIRAY